MTAHDHAIARLAAADRELDANGVVRRSMDPTRDDARSLEAIGRALLPRCEGWTPLRSEHWAEGLAATAHAIREHFPDNVFWDLEHLAACLTRTPAIELGAHFAHIVDLHAQFGACTAIRFRYVHDFLYGFDWAKWVQRAPDERAHVGPFDPEFLHSMQLRGRELEQLIAHNDALYPRLRDTEARNPFVFSREPDDELALHRELASHDLVPIRAWCFDAEPVWNRPFAGERVARADALGLTRCERERSSTRSEGS